MSLVVPARSVRLGLAGTVILALGLSACGGQAVPISSEDSLNAAFGLPDLDTGTGSSRAEFEHDLVQAEIVSCMAEQGFDYLAEPFDAGIVPEPSDAEALETAERNGFGVSLAWGNPSFDPSAVAGPLPEHDVNYDYRQTLSEEELARYEAALEGGPDERRRVGADTAPGEHVPTPTLGCYGEARRAALGDRDARLAAVFPFRLELADRLEGDARVLAMQDGWAACMAESGFDFRDQEAMYEYLFGDFSERLATALGYDSQSQWLPQPSPEEQSAFVDPDSGGAGPHGAGPVEPRTELPDGVDREALTTLQDEERRIATAELTCLGQAYTDIDEVAAAVEAQYLRDNRGRIGEAVAALEEAARPGRSGE